MTPGWASQTKGVYALATRRLALALRCLLRVEFSFVSMSLAVLVVLESSSSAPIGGEASFDLQTSWFENRDNDDVTMCDVIR
jgi:hypothetical protein